MLRLDRRGLFALAPFLALLVSGAACAPETAETGAYDLLITDARVVDGAGNPGSEPTSRSGMIGSRTWAISPGERHSARSMPLIGSSRRGSST